MNQHSAGRPGEEGSTERHAPPGPLRFDGDLSALTSRTYLVEDDHWDPLAAASDGATVVLSPRVEIVAWGEAARIRLPSGLAAVAGTDAISRALGRIGTDDAVRALGSGPLAVGALGFDPGSASELVVPRWTAARSSGGLQWRTETGPARTGRQADTAVPAPFREPGGHPLDDRADRGGREWQDGWSPDRFVLESGVPHADFCKLVDLAVERIGAGELRKVVVARDVRVTTNRPIVLGEVLGRLRALFPSCTLFSTEGFVGATPELLVRLEGGSVLSRPLAGTAAHSGDSGADAVAENALMRSPKDRREHRLAVQTVAEELSRHCGAVRAPETPELLRLRNVSHLASPVTATLRSAVDAAGLAGALHPTGAVCGYPRRDALRFLAAHEPLARGRYAGPVGWVGASGDGEWWVGIRSAEIDGSAARLFAGVGVVEGSRPRAELAETQLKLQALLAALVRP